MIAGTTSASDSATAGTARGPSAPPRGASRSASTRRRPHAERRHDREPDQPVADVVVVHVAELVRDDEPRLGRREVVRSACRRARPAWSLPSPVT